MRKTWLNVLLIALVSLLGLYAFYAAGTDRQLDGTLPLQTGNDLCTHNADGINNYYVPPGDSFVQLKAEWADYLNTFEPGCTVQLDRTIVSTPWLDHPSHDPNIQGYKQISLLLKYPSRTQTIHVWLLQMQSGAKKLWPSFGYPLMSGARPPTEQVELSTSYGAVLATYSVPEPAIVFRFHNLVYVGFALRIVPTGAQLNEYQVQLYTMLDQPVRAQFIQDVTWLPVKYRDRFAPAYGKAADQDAGAVNMVWFNFNSERDYDPAKLVVGVKVSPVGGDWSLPNYLQLAVDSRPDGGSPYYNHALAVSDAYNIISAVTLVDTTALSDGIPGYRWTFAAQIDGSSLPNGVQVTLFCSLLQLYLRDSTAVSSGCDFQQTYVQGDKRHVKVTFEIRDADRKDWSLDRVEYRYQTAEDIVVPITLWEASQH